MLTVTCNLAKATESVRTSTLMEDHRCLTELLLGHAQLADPDRSANRHATNNTATTVKPITMYGKSQLSQTKRPTICLAWPLCCKQRWMLSMINMQLR